MSQDKLIKLKCSETGDIRYTRRTKRVGAEKLELKKYNPTLRKVTVYKEMKK